MSVADPLMDPDAAVIVVLPAARPAANPGEADELLTFATLAADDVHVTELVRSCVLVSL